MTSVPLTEFVIALGVALVAAVAALVAIWLVVRFLARRWNLANTVHQKGAAPLRLFVLTATLTGITGSIQPEGVNAALWGGIHVVLRLLDIAAGAWLVASVLLFLEDLGLRRYDLDDTDNVAARRLHTQVRVIQRLTVVIIVIIAVGAGLLSFPAVRAVGASLLASAGLVSVVAAVAAQSTLANVFAGIQIAFNNAIRLDDVVVVDGQWGRVEELTLSYVVVRLWDDRHLVLPATYVTNQPFENWTRSKAELVGAVEMDLDWRVDVEALRDYLGEVLAGTDLWDGRSQGLQVTEAVDGKVRIRAVMTAPDAPTLWDLRCLVRERFVVWAREHAEASALPLQRLRVLADG